MDRFAELLRSAELRGAAVGAFTCYDLEAATAVLESCAEAERGAVLLIAEATFRTAGGKLLARALREVVERWSVPVCVQLDHVSDLELMAEALDLGVDAVMADGSRLDFEANVALVLRAVELAASYGAAVEAELGRIEGDEDVAKATQAAGLTDPAEASEFVAATGPACLAVSIGNVHGTYLHPPRLDFERLVRIRERVPVPLSLHGASGLADRDVRTAVANGVRKVNVNTELRAAYFQATRATLDASGAGLDLGTVHEAQIAAMRSVVAAKLALLG